MIISSLLPEINCDIPMPQNTPANTRDCEQYNKKNVCKYKERMEEAIAHIDNLLNGDDEQFADLPLVVDVKCKEFNWVTGVR